METKAQQDLIWDISRRDVTISNEKYVTKSLVDAIPALPRACRVMGVLRSSHRIYLLSRRQGRRAQYTKAFGSSAARLVGYN
jgi:hypothetical protein